MLLRICQEGKRRKLRPRVWTWVSVRVSDKRVTFHRGTSRESLKPLHCPSSSCHKKREDKGKLKSTESRRQLGENFLILEVSDVSNTNLSFSPFSYLASIRFLFLFYFVDLVYPLLARTFWVTVSFCSVHDRPSFLHYFTFFFFLCSPLWSSAWYIAFSSSAAGYFQTQ